MKRILFALATLGLPRRPLPADAQEAMFRPPDRKRTWRAFLGLLLMAASAAQAQYDYTTNSDGITITITQYTGLGGAVTIPTNINGLTVTSIGDIAFEGDRLTSITIPGSVTTIGRFAFYNCTTLASATIPSSVTSIGVAAFGSTSLTNVTIPRGVTNIGDDAFSDCTSLKAITVDSQNSIYSSLNGALFDKGHTTIIQYPVGVGGSYKVPGGVTSIGDEAFEKCYGLTSITIPGSVTSIGSFVFADCVSLTNVTIPGSVTSIGDDAFAHCNELTSVDFKGNAPTADSTVFSYDNKATLYYLFGTTGWSSTFGGIPAVLQPTITIKLETLPTAADATASGQGAYGQGANATATASTTNDCYYFAGWQEGGKTVSTSNPYTFTVTNSETLVANFAQYEYKITTSSSPTNWGTTAGAGTYACGTTPELTATAKFGFAFKEWTSSLGATNTSGSLKIAVTGEESWVANFRDSQAPTIKITSPTAYAKIGAVAYVIEGTVTDNVGVEAVYYDLNDAGWLLASNVNDFELWYSYVTPAPHSTNTLSAYAVDTSGNHSLTNAIKFTCTAAGLAPLSIAGQLAEVVDGTNAADTSFLSFDSAVYVTWSAFTNNESEVGTYTYTPTGPDTAELAPTGVLPIPQGSNPSVLELTFTDGYSATFTNLSGGNGTFQFAPTEQTVPTNLDGINMVATSFYNTNYTSTNTFGSATFTMEDNQGGNSSGTYTFTPFTQVDALLVQTSTNGTTNYLVLMFTEGASPAAGAYSSATFGDSGQITNDTGTFSTEAAGGATPEFAGPATLAGLQVTVTPTGEPSFTRSYGNGTFAAISPTNMEQTDVGIVLANTRLTTNTGMVNFMALAPPYAVGQDDSTVDLTWSKTGASATYTVAGTQMTGTLTNIVAAKNFAAAALSGQSLTEIPVGNGERSTNVFTYNKFTSTGGVAGSGTYTYAPYTPSMALVHFSPTNASSVGQDSFLLIYYKSLTTGAYVYSATNPANPGTWTLKTGSFTMKNQ
jgi:hypothetical protein